MFRWRWWLIGDMLAVMTSDVGDRSDDWVMVSSLEKRGDPTVAKRAKSEVRRRRGEMTN